MHKILWISCFLSFHSLFATPLFIGIAGGTGSGKTTLAEKIHNAFPDNSQLISQDNYYKELHGLSLEERRKTNFDHPDALDFSMLQNHLIALRNNEAVKVPVYNFSTSMRETRENTIIPTDIIIVEGILLFSIPEIRELLDVKIFIDTPNDIRVLRRITRDLQKRRRDFESLQQQYLTTVKPMHELFVEPSKIYADVIVPGGGENQVALELIVAKLRESLR
jgi:uridine kinase